MPINTLVDETIERLKKSLLQPVMSKNKALQKIHSCLEASFAKIDVDKQSLLFRKLSVQLHPDRMFNLQPELYQYLLSIDLVDEPQKHLALLKDQFKEPNPFENIDVSTAPYNGLRTILNYLFIKGQAMLDAYQRYVDPFRTTIWGISWVINIVLITFAIVMAPPILALSFLNWGISKLEPIWLNFITNNEYDREIATYYKNNPEAYSQAKKNYLDNQRKTIIENNPRLEADINEMDDEAFMRFFEASLFKEKQANNNLAEDEEEECKKNIRIEIDSSIKSEQTMHGPTKITLVAQALYHAIVKPLPEGILAKLASILFVRTLLVISTPLVIAASAAIELSKYLTTALVYVAFSLLVAIKAASLLILNAPLYALDAFHYVVNGLASCFSDSEQDLYEPERSKSPATILDVLRPNSSQSEPLSAQSASLEEAIYNPSGQRFFNSSPVIVPIIDDKQQLQSSFQQV